MKANIIRILTCILFMSNSQACIQSDKNTIYQNEKFQLEYSSNWEQSFDNGILNIQPKEDFGAVTISTYQDIDFPLDLTKNFILEMNKIQDNPDKVKMITKGDMTEFLYEHNENDVYWMTKAIRKETDFFLITINCDRKLWSSEKNKFMIPLNSFKLK